jgi:ABC-2 type transport system ATP-binding protein
MVANNKMVEKPTISGGIGNSNAIEVSNLKKYFNAKKSFNSVKAVDGISFEVKEGELFGLLGPNGAGKTTTINMLCGLSKPTEGSIKVGGYDLRKNPRAIKELISICPQKAAVFPFLTGMENIEYFGNMHLMSKERINERGDNLLKLLGLSEASTRKAKNYSGGMMRQLNLIIALINDPKILFLDEPTVGMDPRVRRKTWEFIKSINEEKRTIILTTHYIEEAETLCDRVAIVDYGKLVALDSPKNLMKEHNAKNLEEVFLEITGRRILEGI